MTTPTPAEAHAMGRTGANMPPGLLEAERLAFEAWVQGHCWELGAEWSPLAMNYLAPEESSHHWTPEGILARRMWAAWRDRAALADRAAGRR